MVNFEGGQLVEGAYVLIDGVKYPVVMPKYEGNTPLTPENLNKIQRDLTEVIDEVQENVGTVQESLNTLETKVDGIFKFKKYTKNITISGTSSKSITMGSFSDIEGYVYIGCIPLANAIGDQFLVSYSRYGNNITAMVHNQYAMQLSGDLICVAIFVKEEYYNTNLMSKV